MVRMPFGKHYGRPLREVPTPYLRWCLREVRDLEPGLRAAMVQELAGRPDRRRARGATTDATDGAEPFHPPADWSSVIGRWYRQLALDYHPDRSGDTRSMQIVNDCHERLRKLVGV